MRAVFAHGNGNTVKKLIRLRRQAEKDGMTKVSRRLHAVTLSIQGYTSGEIARLLNVSRTTIPLWIGNWNEYREDGLLEGYRPGRRPRLDASQLTLLEDIVDSGPVAYGLDTGIWTSVIMASVIEEEFNITYHPGHVRKLLRKMGFSVQRPTVKLQKADPKKQRKWIRYTYPNLKKTRQQKER